MVAPRLDIVAHCSYSSYWFSSQHLFCLFPCHLQSCKFTPPSTLLGVGCIGKLLDLVPFRCVKALVVFVGFWVQLHKKLGICFPMLSPSVENHCLVPWKKKTEVLVVVTTVIVGPLAVVVCHEQRFLYLSSRPSSSSATWVPLLCSRRTILPLFRTKH